MVVVGASAGGVRVLCALAAALPADLPAAVVVVLHVPPSGSAVMATILGRSGPMPARTALDGERLRRGTLLLAPAGRDLTLASSRSGPVVSLSPTVGVPAPGDHHPGVDALLVSAATTLGPRAVAVVLSGDGQDGAVGTAAVLAAGGTVVVQDPDDALHPSMPLAALAAAGASGAPPSRVVLATAGGLGAALTALVTGSRRAPTLARAS